MERISKGDIPEIITEDKLLYSGTPAINLEIPDVTRIDYSNFEMDKY